MRKVGKEMPIKESPISHFAIREFLFKATKTPKGIPTNVATNAEKNASSIVAGIFAFSNSDTGAPCLKETARLFLRKLRIVPK